jgi:hypothetical protein
MTSQTAMLDNYAAGFNEIYGECVGSDRANPLRSSESWKDVMSVLEMEQAAGGLKNETNVAPMADSVLKGQNIVCFAKDWSEDPTSCNHVLRELAKNNKVLWLNSISTRAPKLTSGRDLSKIWKKLASFLQGPRKVDESMWVYTPLVLPFHNSKRAVAVNRLLLRLTLAVLGRRLGMKSYQLWTFVPTSAHYVGSIEKELLVYYVVDNWAGFSSVDSAQMKELVGSLARQADIVFATSHSLVEDLLPNNPNTHLAAHGVNYDDFARATEEATPLPADLAALPQPILGFYGLIEDWMDQDLIAYLADRHPEWSIALIGRSCVDTSRLEKCPNVHFLGRKPYGELPNYCKGFAVGLIPHHVNELTIYMNPIKLREYMSAGLSIVATALPEVRHYPDHCTIANTYEEFEQGVELALSQNTPALRRERSIAMKSETWENKVRILSEQVVATQRRKSASAGTQEADMPVSPGLT